MIRIREPFVSSASARRVERRRSSSKTSGGRRARVGTGRIDDDVHRLRRASIVRRRFARRRVVRPRRAPPRPCARPRLRRWATVPVDRFRIKRRPRANVKRRGGIFADRRDPSTGGNPRVSSLAETIAPWTSTARAPRVVVRPRKVSPPARTRASPIRAASPVSPLPSPPAPVETVRAEAPRAKTRVRIQIRTRIVPSR